MAALELARSGVGICLARGLLVRDDLRAGRLVRLLDAEASLREDYTAVWNPASQRADMIRPFVDWLAQEMSEPVSAPTLYAA
jgi:LysR family glycine cleavage system transcriptional activator